MRSSPFVQGSGNAARFGGAGMGLPLAKGFLEANGATLEILSEKSVGTAIKISFPEALADQV